jgi:hypothetical protein
MARWLRHPSSSVQGGGIFIHPDEVAVVESTLDGGSRISTKGGVTLASSTPALTVMKALSDPPEAPANVKATLADPTVATPTISGTAEPRATVTVFEGNTVLGTTVAGASGTWSLDTSPLAVGTHSIAAWQRDIFGNASAHSAPLSLAIKAPAPPPPPPSPPPPPAPTPAPPAAAAAPTPAPAPPAKPTK